MEKSTKEFSFDLVDIVAFLVKYFKPIATITIIAAVVSIIVSFLLTPKYESTTVIYPTSTNSISKAILSPNYTNKDILNYGEDEETEVLLQFLNSGQILERLNRKFNLIEHYKINPESKYPYTQLANKYASNVDIRETKYMSVKITVEDESPEMAAKIANEIVTLIDTLANQMKKERAEQAYEIVKKEYLNVEESLQYLEDSIKKIRAKGINDYESQSERYNEAYAYALKEGDNGGVKKLESKLDNLSQYGGEYVNIMDKILHESSRLSQLKTKLIEAKVDAREFLTNKFVVDRAYPSEKKSFPVRWLIVSASTITAFFFALVLFIFIEKMKPVYQELRQKTSEE